MRKIFKGLAVLLATAALGAGVATATACDGGYNGVYNGEYHYTSHDQEYGMKVKVTVENNIITKVEDVTNGAYIVVSDGWETYSQTIGMGGQDAPSWYTWTDDNNSYWKESEAWLLQQYEGKAVADVLSIKVYVDEEGVPYKVTDDRNQSRNPELDASGLLVGGATQGSGRLLLAVQNALKK